MENDDDLFYDIMSLNIHVDNFYVESFILSICLFVFICSPVFLLPSIFFTYFIFPLNIYYVDYSTGASRNFYRYVVGNDPTGTGRCITTEGTGKNSQFKFTGLADWYECCGYYECKRQRSYVRQRGLAR